MGAPTAQVQPSQSSAPASKGAGQSASSEAPAGKGGQLTSMSGQPTMGQPNTNGNTNLAPVNAGLTSPNDVKYANTVEPTGDGRNALPNSSFGKGAGSNF